MTNPRSPSREVSRGRCCILRLAGHAGRKGPLILETLLLAALNLGLARPVAWLWDRLLTHGAIRIDVVEEPGPTTRGLGFTEKAIKVTVSNHSAATIQIQDIRLMFAGGYGVPVPVEAPPGRSHPELPAKLSPESSGNWYFPAERLASLLGALSTRSVAERPSPKLYPRLTTATGKIHRGHSVRFNTDVNAHWP